MVVRRLVNKYLVIAIAVILLVFGGWVIFRNLFVAIIRVPSSVKADQMISLHVSYPGWKPARFSVRICPRGTEEFTACSIDARFGWDGRYHFDGDVAGLEAPGNYNVYLVYGEKSPIDHGTEAETQLKVLP